MKFPLIWYQYEFNRLNSFFICGLKCVNNPKSLIGTKIPRPQDTIMTIDPKVLHRQCSYWYQIKGKLLSYLLKISNIQHCVSNYC